MEAPADKLNTGASRIPGWWRWFALAVLIAGLVYLVRSRPELMEDLRARMILAGAWAPLLYILLHSSRAFTWIPGNILSPLGGLLFGLWGGLLYTWIGLMGACILAFALVRLVRPPQRTGPLAQRFQRLLERCGGRLWMAVLLSRLVPGVPFNVSSYMAGATDVSWPGYLWSTGVGILPRMSLQVALGAGLYGVAAA